MWQNPIDIANPYFHLVNLRNCLYDRGLLKMRKVDLPVISVGNLACGGRGKTSVVRYLAQLLSHDQEVLVLSRGYRRGSKGFRLVLRQGELCSSLVEAGDEPYLLAKLFEGNSRVSIAVCEDRYLGALTALKIVSPSVIVLDDGFQHRAFYRDLDLVLLRKMDLTDRVLPFGRLREPLSSLKRAHGIIFAYQELEPFEFSFEEKPMFKMFRRNFRLMTSDLKEVSPVDLPEVVAFSGLGDNRQFFSVLRRLGLRLRKILEFPDHYDYQGLELKESEVYVTTLKDWVKLKPQANLWVLDYEVEIPLLEDFLRKRLRALVLAKGGN